MSVGASVFWKTNYIVFMVSIATVSFRDLFGLPVLNFAFNTTVPTIILTYIAMTAVLYWTVPETGNAATQ